mgnify:CR=1 FL=1
MARAGLGRKCRLAALIVWCALFGPSLLLAIHVNPTRVELSVRPGGEYAGSLELTSDSNDTVRVVIGVTDQTPFGDGPARRPWFFAEERELELQPGEGVDCPFRVSVPSNAVGELKAKLSFTTYGRSSSTPISIIPVIGVPIYVVVEGTEVYDLRIRACGLRSADPLEVALTMENRGNTHVRPQGVCVITDLESGRVLRQIPVNKLNLRDIGWPVMPGETAELYARPAQTDDDKSLPPGRYGFDIRINHNGQDMSQHFEATVP